MLSPEIKNEIRESLKEAAKIIPDFKSRSSQNQMIAEIAKTLSGEYKTNPILCVEAPTGVGKTMSYLLSAIPIAIKNKTKLIVSSVNVALQEQILFKDILEAQKYCKTPFSYAIVKGRSRYLCFRDLINLTENKSSNQKLFEDDDFEPAKYQVKKLNKLQDDFETQKWNGEIDDLKTQPDKVLWSKIASNRFTCTGKNCEYYKDCAFFLARKKIFKTDVLITNHDLILSDLSNGNTILPAVNDSIFIFDEAHHLGQKALSHFALATSTDAIKTTVKNAIKTVSKIAKITKQEQNITKSDDVDGFINDLIKLFDSLKFNNDIHIFEQGKIDDDIITTIKNLNNSIKSSHSEFENHRSAYSSYLEDNQHAKNTGDQLNNAIGEVSQHLAAILAALASSLEITDAKQPPFSRWIEITTLSNKKPNYHINSAKIDVSNQLASLIWSQVKGAVLTSATMTSLGNFDRLNQQLGLLKVENQYLKLASPFKYQEVDFVIANIKSNPTEAFEHTQEIASELPKRIDKNTGTLMLFASNKQMNEVADLVEEKLGCQLFVQGQFNKKTILEKHIKLRKQGKGSIIFGVDSFAEGVDLRGDYLTHLLIAKLRFSVPTSPIEKTTSDYLQSKNRNPFMEISLPDASLRLIQACGRLIRSETDSGKITIFDNRLHTKRYGAQLLAALPNYNIIIE